MLPSDAVTGPARGDDTRLLERLAGAGALVLLGLLPFHLVLKAHAGMLPLHLATWWKDVLAVAAGVSMALAAVLRGGWRALRPPAPLDAAVAGVCIVAVARALPDLVPVSPRGWGHDPALWGLWMTLGFVPLYAVGRCAPPAMAVFLQRAAWRVVAATGVLCAVGALAEAVLGRALFPSSAHLRQFGYAEIYVWGTHIVRPYVTFDHPVGLGAYLAVALLGLTAGAAALDDRPHARLIRGAGVLGVLVSAAGLALTYSRGPWVGACAGLAALLVAGLRVRRRAVPAALWSGAVLILVLLAVGPVESLLPHTAQPVAVPRVGSQGTPGAILTVGRAGLALAGAAGLARQSPPQAPNLGSRRVGGRWFTQWKIAGVSLPVLFEHPPARGTALLEYVVGVPRHCVLQWSIALDPRVWDRHPGAGVLFQIALQRVPSVISRPAEPPRLIFSRYIDPKHRQADRRWFSFLFPLRDYAGASVRLDLLTAAGPSGDSRYAWAGWGAPRLRVDPAGRAPSYAVSALPAGTASTGAAPGWPTPYVATLADWHADEGNLGRLRAWRASLARWKAHPLLGTGVGTTDEIAVRFRGAAALVTESELLKHLVEEGMPGLLSWLVLGAAALWAAGRALATPRGPADPARGPLLATWAALVCIATVALTFQVLEVKQIAALFWFLLGFAARPPAAVAPPASTGDLTSRASGSRPRVPLLPPHSLHTAKRAIAGVPAGAQWGTGQTEGGGAMFCSRCGKRLDGRARFCDECGMPRRETAGRAGATELVYGAAVPAGDVLVPSPPDSAVPAGVPASIATGGTPVHQALPGGTWSAEFTSAAPAGVAQSLSVHPTINVAVTPPPAAAPVAGATVVVVGDGGQSLAMIAAWVLGMAAATGLTVMVIAAFITARAPEALVIALPLLLAFYALAAVGLRRGR